MNATIRARLTKNVMNDNGGHGSYYSARAVALNLTVLSPQAWSEV